VDRLPSVSAISVEEVIAGFVPTRRFADVSFDSYEPDPRYPSQRAAQERLREFAARIGQRGRAALLGRLLRKVVDTPQAIYLDGGYGVGKTHLLAATYHAVGEERRYLSFGELAYAIARLGLDSTLHAFKNTRLVCIDEFELDDVAQTRMATMFLRRLLERRGTPVSVVTTSNTLPSDLGQGRFAAEAFQREIGEIASRFEVVTIDGEDYRHRQWDELARGRSDVVDPALLRRCYEVDDAPEEARVLVEWSALARQLGDVHPVQYAQIATRLAGVYVYGVRRIDDQAVALRFVHFVDKLYDQEVRIAVSTVDDMPLREVFSPAYRHGGYEKKYRRCLSRLHELVRETRGAHANSDASRSARESTVQSTPSNRR
jgi:cell division protein ZapE